MSLVCQDRQLELASRASKHPHLTESVNVPLFDLVSGLQSSFTTHLNTDTVTWGSICVQQKDLSNRYAQGNRNFLSEKKYLKQCTAVSLKKN